MYLNRKNLSHPQLRCTYPLDEQWKIGRSDQPSNVCEVVLTAGIVHVVFQQWLTLCCQGKQPTSRCAWQQPWRTHAGSAERTATQDLICMGGIAIIWQLYKGNGKLWIVCHARPSNRTRLPVQYKVICCWSCSHEGSPTMCDLSVLSFAP